MRAQWLLAIALALVPAAAGATDPNVNYDVRTLTFDTWCQQTQHYDAERCDRRTAGDEAEFETYRATVERYEIPYLKREEQERHDNERLSHDVQPWSNNPNH